MKKKIAIMIILVLSLSVLVSAQISRDITKIRCGDGVLDKFEMCEKGVESDKCDKMAELLKIDTGCFERECVCVPFVNKAFCGNNRREGVEMCDGTSEEDFCPEFGKEIGLNLTCNPATCLCDIVTGVPEDYDPSYNQTNETPEGMAVCGDGKLQRMEECDPPNTLCNLPDGHVGVCVEGCKCVKKESISPVEAEKNEPENETEKPEENDSAEPEQINATIDETSNTTEENSPETDSTAVARQGFFARFWSWFKELFS